MIEKITRIAVTAPSFAKSPKSRRPKVDRSGACAIAAGTRAAPGVVNPPRGEDLVEHDGDDRRCEDADQQRAARAARHEPRRQHEADEKHRDRQAAERPEPDRQGAGRGLDHQARGEEADERDEEADADADRPLEPDRDGIHQRLAKARQHEHRDDRALEEHHRHRLGPRESATRDQVECDDRVEPHPGGEREGIVADEAHRDREHARRETRDGERGRER